MFPEEMISANPRGSVLIFEDDDAEAAEICTGLAQHGIGDRHVVANSIEDFEYQIHQGGFDLFSIDWLDRSSKAVGGRALKVVRNEQKDAAAIVFSIYAPKIQDWAIRKGADDIVQKSADLEESSYFSKMHKGMRVASARRIVGILGELKVADIPTIEERLDLSVETEKEVGDLARRVAIESVIYPPANRRLIGALNDRGWWRHFDQASYSQMQWNQKIEHLVKAANIPHDVLVDFAGGESEELESVLATNAYCATEGTIAHRLDLLLSLLFFLLRLCAYEIEALPRFASTKRLFGNSCISPPWDDLGVLNFVKSCTLADLMSAITWCRKIM